MFFLILFILTSVQGLPTRQSEADLNCLHITDEIQKQIDDVTDKITTFIRDLSTRYDDVDLRIVKIALDRHSVEERRKRILLKIDVNDCDDDKRYSKYDAYVKNNERNRMKYNNIKSIQDSVQFGDEKADEDPKDRGAVDRYSFTGETRFVFGDEVFDDVVNYEKGEGDGDGGEKGQLIYYVNFNNINDTCQKCTDDIYV